ncbi:MAG: nucleoside hydrolase [Planctomycetaceae bacterium]|nr:nucleoside hydrolase [Planctomycetaceae bacterium]
MKHLFFTVLSFCAFFCVCCYVSAAELPRKPLKVIYDTDIGNDMDDVMALAAIHALQTRNELELLAVTITKDNEHAAPMTDLVNTFYNRGNIPIGVVKNGVTKEDGKYNKQVVELKNPDGSPMFKRTLASYEGLPDATTLLRKTLAAQEDNSVVIIQVGFFTNLHRLLESAGDNFSPLSGKELVAKKVKYIAIMAGAMHEKYKNHKEYNVIMDLPASRKFVDNCPVDIIFNGYELGAFIEYSVPSINNDFFYVPNHPIRHGHLFYKGGFDKKQASYDINSVVYAARPDRGYYGLSERGAVSFDEQGITHFKADPNGKHRFQTVTDMQIAVVREVIAALVSQPPCK